MIRHHGVSVAVKTIDCMDSGRKKLTARDVLKIYRSRWTAEAAEVAERYNISRSMVYKIYRRVVWSSVLEHLDQGLDREDNMGFIDGTSNRILEEHKEEGLDGTTV